MMRRKYLVFLLHGNASDDSALPVRDSLISNITEANFEPSVKILSWNVLCNRQTNETGRPINKKSIAKSLKRLILNELIVIGSDAVIATLPETSAEYINGILDTLNMDENSLNVLVMVMTEHGGKIHNLTEQTRFQVYEQ